MLFIDHNSTIDKEALVQYVKNELLNCQHVIDQLLIDNSYSTFWEGLHNAIVNISNTQDKQNWMRVEKQIKGLHNFINIWLSSSVESLERFEFFIQAKAAEINSGDNLKDYFLALQMRHDQLVALVSVLNTLSKHMDHWVVMKPENVLNDPVFMGIAQYSIEDQIYLEAKKIYQARQKLLN